MEWHGGRHYHEEPTLFAILLNPPLLGGTQSNEVGLYQQAFIYIIS